MGLFWWTCECGAEWKGDDQEESDQCPDCRAREERERPKSSNQKERDE